MDTDKTDKKPETEKPAAASDLKILSLEEFVDRFSYRYEKEESFKIMVHKYLNISKMKKVALGISKYVFKGWYEKETENIIVDYATKIREDLVEVSHVLADTSSLHAESSAYEQKDAETRKAEQQSKEAKKGLENTVYEMTSKLNQTREKYQTKIQEEKEAAEKEKEKIKESTDSKRIVKDAIKSYVKKSGLFVVGGDGSLTFDELALSKKLEDLYLQEIINGMASEGDTGFFSRMREAYEGIVTRVEELEDISEIDKIDYVESIIYSRTRGYKKPTFPYFMVGKCEGLEALKSTIDTATSTDISGSMSENDRIVVAKKTNLAISALMRKLNPKNNHYQSVFNGSLKDVDTMEMIRNVYPDNGTETQLAIDWFIDKLKDSGMSIANLITDGRPNNPELCYDAAKRLSNHPNILLRIYLIDGDKESEEIMRKVGKYAGNSTKFIPLKKYKLSGDVLRGLEECLTQMYDISNF